MILGQPEQGAANEKTPHFAAAIIENVGVPVWMDASTGVRMLKEMRPIEKAEARAVRRKMSRHPIQYDPNPMQVQFIDQIHEVLRGSIIARRSKVSGGLVPPRAEKRMVHDREEFHMGEPHLLEVCRQCGSEFPVAQRTVFLFRNSFPRSDVHFIDGDGRVEAILLAPGFHPLSIPPYIIQIPYNRSGLGRNFIKNRKWVGFFDFVVASSRTNMKFVERTLSDTREESF